jgi:hypothetical protein
VLAQIPSIVLESDRVAQRRRRVLVSLATVAIVGVVLLGAAVGYYTVNGGGAGAAQPSGQPVQAAEPQG